jgi:peptidyl-prolyl cis-trans isomerase C
MLIKSRVVLGAAALMALAACSHKDADKASAPAASASASAGAVAATVNGTPISMARLDQIMKQQAMQGMPDNAETRKMVIDKLAMQMLVAQAATDKGLDKSTEVTDELEMAKQGILAQAYVQDYMKSNTVTDDVLKAKYDEFKEKNGKEYKAHHILVKTEDEAKDIIAQLKKDPKSFESIAKAKSQDPGSAPKGGDLGWFNVGTMVPEFSAATAKLEKGKFTETPVKTQFGYHVIELDDTRAANIPSLDQIKPQFTQQIQQDNLKKMIEDMKSKAKIEITAAATPAPAALPVSPASAAPEATPAAAAPAASK